MDDKKGAMRFCIGVLGGIILGALIGNMAIGIVVGFLVGFGLLKWPFK